MHWIARSVFYSASSEFSRFLVYEESGKRVEDIDLASLKQVALFDDLMQSHHIIRPVVVMKRDGLNILVDGKHRAYFAHHLNLLLPVKVIRCFCRDDSITPCHRVNTLVQSLHAPSMPQVG